MHGNALPVQVEQHRVEDSHHKWPMVSARLAKMSVLVETQVASAIAEKLVVDAA